MHHRLQSSLEELSEEGTSCFSRTSPQLLEIICVLKLMFYQVLLLEEAASLFPAAKPQNNHSEAVYLNRWLAY